jgi:[ribosomal protein S5]-alanine N-acetyltransferase
MVKLQGSVFCLRGWQLTDEEALVKYANNPRVSANLFDRFPYPYTAQDARQWLNSQQGIELPAFLAIEINGEAVGGIGITLKADVFRRGASIGYWLGQPFWGKGIMTDVVNLMVDYAFKNFDLVRLEAGVYQTNPASMRVLEKAGFVKEGIAKKAIFKRGELLDEYIYALVR